VSDLTRAMLKAWRLGGTIFSQPTEWGVELTSLRVSFIELATGKQFDIERSDARDRIRISRVGLSQVRKLKHLQGHLLVTVSGVSAWNLFSCVFEGEGLVQLSRWLGLPGWGCCPSCLDASASLLDQLDSKLTTCSKCGTVYPTGLTIDIGPSGEVRFGSLCPRCRYPILASDLPEPDSDKHLACPRCGADITTTKDGFFEKLFGDMLQNVQGQTPQQGTRGACAPMKKCNFCGEEIPDTTVVCRWCGRKQKELST